MEPICQASMTRVREAGETGDNGIVLFANPASEARQKMTLRLSVDECRSWSSGRQLYTGPAAYSDLAVTPEGEILCLYERGADGPL